jgi:hypothetical protein
LESFSGHADVQGAELLTGGREPHASRRPPSVALRSRLEPELRERGLDDRTVPSELAGRWLPITRDLFYEEVPAEVELERTNRYLGNLLDIIRGCGITIHYYFDSCIEMMLSARQRRLGTPTRFFEVAYDGFLATGVKAALVYHPNGYLPINVLEECSSDLVLSEREFNEQIANTFTVRNAFTG